MKTQSKNGSLSDKKVLVLGGSSGIGLATAQAAAAEGASVVIVSSNQQRLDEALTQLPEGSTGYKVDLGNEDQIKELFVTLGKFDHLIYSAGENIRLGKLEDVQLEEGRAYFNIRYWGALMAVKYGTPYLNEGGSISLTSGIASARPGSGWGLSASICAAMEGFTRAMAIELAPIRVNIVSPGVVRTNLWSGMSESERNGMYEQVGSRLPVKRVGEASDVARTFVYLMQQQFVTGQTLIVDGGTVLV